MSENEKGSEMTAADLAAAIDEFSYEYDPYGYHDAVDDRKEAVNELAVNLDRGNALYIREWLYSIVRENDAHSPRARQLLDQFTGFETQRAEAYFQNSPADAFAICQLKDGDELHDIRFEPLSWLQSIDRAVERDNYNLVYAAPLTDSGSTSEKLDALWYRFNNERPEDFYGHSLSVSDIVVLKQNGQISCHYVDSFGFQNLPDFYSENRAEHADRYKEVLERLAAEHIKQERDTPLPSHDERMER